MSSESDIPPQHPEIKKDFNMNYFNMEYFNMKYFNMKYLLCIPIVVFAWEHIARINCIVLKPSYITNLVSEQIGHVMTFIGSKFAAFSSYFHYLRLGELGLTIRDLCLSGVTFVCSFFKFIKGYSAYAQTFLDDSWQIYAGSIIFFFVLAYFAFRYYQSKKR